jgi:hypothetical protein
LLTKRVRVRNLSAEADNSDFEILSDLLVNDVAPFIGKNGPYCGKPAYSRLANIAADPSNLLRLEAFSRETLSVSAGACASG